MEEDAYAQHKREVVIFHTLPPSTYSSTHNVLLLTLESLSKTSWIQSLFVHTKYNTSPRHLYIHFVTLLYSQHVTFWDKVATQVGKQVLASMYSAC